MHAVIEVYEDSVAPRQLQSLTVLRILFWAKMAWRTVDPENRKHAFIGLVSQALTSLKIVCMLLAIVAINMSYLRVHQLEE